MKSGFVLFLGPQNDKLYNANTSSETDLLVLHQIFLDTPVAYVEMQKDGITFGFLGVSRCL